MENKHTAVFMGLNPAMIEKYSREYMATNPHNLPDLPRKRRRVVRSELVCTTRPGN